MKYLLVIILSVVLHTHLSAQQIIARQAPFYYELFSNEIWDYYQDNEGYLWIATTDGLARYDGYNLQFFRSDDLSPNVLTNNSITCVSDNNKYVWVGTQKGLNLFDKETCKILPFPDKNLQDRMIDVMHTLNNETTWVACGGKIYKCGPEATIEKEYVVSTNTIKSIYTDRKGDIWVLVWNGGLFKYDFDNDRFNAYPKIGEKNSPFVMYQDNKSNYWIGTWGDGLWKFYPERIGTACYERRHVMDSKDGQPDTIFYSLTQDDTFGYLWAMSYNELYALNITDTGLEKVDIQDILNTRMMYTRIFKDRSGNLWLSSFDIPYTLFFDSSGIKNYPLQQIKERLGSDANLMNLCVDGDVVWMVQDRHGLCLWDMATDNFSFNQLPEANILCNSVQGVWVSETDNSKTSRIMRVINQDMKVFVKESFDLRSVVDSPGGIVQLLEDLEGNLWILTNGYLFMKPVKNSSLLVNDDKLSQLSGLSLDEHGDILAVGRNLVLYRLKYEGNRIIYEQPGTQSVLADNEQIKKSCIDQNGCLWIITSLDRIYRSDTNKKEFQKITIETEINNGSVLNLRSDDKYVWIVMNKKVIRYDINDHSIVEFSTSDKTILVNLFRNRAMAPDGMNGLFVGGHGGILHIPPHQKNKNVQGAVHLAVTDVKANNRSVLFSNTNSNNTFDNIKLDSDCRNIEILFSTLQYQLTPKVRIAYKLEGVDTDWIYPNQDKQSAIYNQLNKGKYKFWMRYENEQGERSDQKVYLTIEKYPAIYETWYAYLLYSIAILSLGYLLLHIWLKREKKKNEKKFKEELDKAKLEYFTDISHDVLTPLTIISGTVDNLDKKEPSLKNQTHILKSNVDKLKRLIQQMLDFRKMDMGRLPLMVSYGDINYFINRICQTAFVPLAQKKNIQLSVELPEQLKGYVDFEKLDKILYNLLSNALKYTSENKAITVSAQQGIKRGHPVLILKVTDEGIGIRIEEQKHIFTRFYVNRTNREVESNGIGLSLTKDLITLHHGTISVESEPDKGSSFTVELPIDKASYSTEEIVNETNSKEMMQPEVHFASLVGNTDKLTLLLIDDNTELLYVIQELFSESYNVVTATSAKQGKEQLNINDVDIIICDVMMPGESGWEFCKQVKSDVRFNHIPVIILTAKNDVDDRVTSYEVGADAYIAKPFEVEVLQARVDNLAKSYKARQEAFRKEQNVSLASITEQSGNKKFLRSLIENIEQHLDETEFDLEQLSSQLNMSKSTLHRKIKTLSGLTPLDFIRNVKMKRACMMLRTKELTIAEISYAVGYNNPGYFSKCFKDEFGITPSEYQQTL
jgi:signal transduction histidine kinase/DNA-binding response OmpR family regulator/ligand-binding sensor domain-containing protein